MIYLDDKITRHPKILAAGRGLGGGDGVARVFTLFVEAIAYSRQYWLDGFVPDSFIEASTAMRRPADVAVALADAKLFHRDDERGGYVVHDFHVWNKSAEALRDTREKWRSKKAAQRRAGGRFNG